MAGEITRVGSLGAVCPHTGLAAQDTATATQAATAILTNTLPFWRCHTFTTLGGTVSQVTSLVRTLGGAPISRPPLSTAEHALQWPFLTTSSGVRDRLFFWVDAATLTVKR